MEMRPTLDPHLKQVIRLTHLLVELPPAAETDPPTERKPAPVRPVKMLYRLSLHCPSHSVLEKAAETDWRVIWSSVSMGVIVSVHSHGIIYDPW